MIIEQKIREIFVECAMRGKLCPRPEDCQDISCSECKIDLILGLLEPQQPVEGNISREEFQLLLGDIRVNQSLEATNAVLAERDRLAQRAFDLATMVKVSWLFERCPHSTDPLFLATRHECDECMEELLRKEQVEESRSHE